MRDSCTEPGPQRCRRGTIKRREQRSVSVTNDARRSGADLYGARSTTCILTKKISPTKNVFIVLKSGVATVYTLLKWLVGARGFEPPASWSRTRRSTRLSHAPTLVNHFSLSGDGFSYNKFAPELDLPQLQPNMPSLGSIFIKCCPTRDVRCKNNLIQCKAKRFWFSGYRRLNRRCRSH